MKVDEGERAFATFATRSGDFFVQSAKVHYVIMQCEVFVLQRIQSTVCEATLCNFVQLWCDNFSSCSCAIPVTICIAQSLIVHQALPATLVNRLPCVTTVASAVRE